MFSRISVFFSVFTLLFAVSAKALESQNVIFFGASDGSTTLPFSEAVKVGDSLMLSGQIGMSPETKKLVVGGFAAEAKQTLLNIENILTRHKYKMSDVVKCTVILSDMDNYSVFNGIYKKAFSSPYPARTTFAVDSLAFDAEIEIECMAGK